MSEMGDWRPASEAVCKEAYRHLIVHNLAFYRWLPPLDKFRFWTINGVSLLYATTGEWRWVFEVWTHPGDPRPTHAFELFVGAPDNSSLQIAAGQFIAALVPVPLGEELP